MLLSYSRRRNRRPSREALLSLLAVACLTVGATAGLAFFSYSGRHFIPAGYAPQKIYLPVLPSPPGILPKSHTQIVPAAGAGSIEPAQSEGGRSETDDQRRRRAALLLVIRSQAHPFAGMR